MLDGMRLILSQFLSNNYDDAVDDAAKSKQTMYLGLE